MSVSSRPVWAHSLSSTVVLMAPFDLLASLAMDVYLPAVPVMPEALGASAATVQLTLSLYLLMLGLGQLVFGPLSDRIGRRPVLLAGGSLFVLASLALALVTTGTAFLAWRVVQALGASAALVATFATVRDVYADLPESATIYGLFSAMLAFVPALGPILGAFVIQAWGWRAVFGLLGLLGVLALGRAGRHWPETRERRCRASRASLRAVLSHGDFWIYTVGFSAAMGAFFVFFSTAPRVLISGAGLSPLAFSVIFGAVASVMIVTTRFTGGALARWGIPGCLVRGAATMMGGACCLAVTTLSWPGAWLGFVLPMGVIAVGIVLMVSVTASGALRAFDETAGLAVACYYAVQSVIVVVVGTAATLGLGGDTPWPLATYAVVMPALAVAGLAASRRVAG
ncbi:CmlA/FloR family chloramphenicol efflux MFS transporter [Achromobacter sp. GG226]|uniref:CmlA/FloR family chloramphenicol efflux MFS transporter n=1 Tax=Verticiella alkaliphila TaxID=2779529 RepID=UPI001C0E7636|nr:CmlA/FloR family chloramphenicol efflux MFS transporter [Verticiella sp. GG226]MBU4610648.1 CmlA/FloR family chloramphenicol efflux MFS transporter [Verticiella sp. GG226]